jgi:hypothetical protein
MTLSNSRQCVSAAACRDVEAATLARDGSPPIRVSIAFPLMQPLSRGSSPAGYPAEPLVSYRINRQFSGWNLPPLMIRAFGAHGQ